MIAALFAPTAMTPAAETALRLAGNARDLLLLLAGAAVCLPLGRLFPRLGESLGEGKLRPLSYVLCFLLLALCITELAAGGFAPFIYTQF